jgi:hypothetical protein
LIGSSAKTPAPCTFERLRPILRLGAARAGADLELCVAKVVRTRQQRPQSEGLDLVRECRRFSRDLRGQLLVGLGNEHLFELGGALHATVECVVRLDPDLHRFHLLHDGLRALLIVPESGRRHSILEPPQRIALGIEVKDTS